MPQLIITNKKKPKICYITITSVSFPADIVHITWATNAVVPFQSSPALTFEWSLDGKVWNYLGTALLDALQFDIKYPSAIPYGKPLHIRGKATTDGCGDIASNIFDTAGLPAKCALTVLSAAIRGEDIIISWRADLPMPNGGLGITFELSENGTDWLFFGAIISLVAFSETSFPKVGNPKYIRIKSNTAECGAVISPPREVITAIQSPSCKRYVVSLYVPSGEHMWVDYTDCDGNPAHEDYYAQGGFSNLSTEFCALEDSVQTNGNITEMGLCSQ